MQRLINLAIHIQYFLQCCSRLFPLIIFKAVVVNTGEASFDGFNETVAFLNIYSPQIDHCNGILRNSLT